MKTSWINKWINRKNELRQSQLQKPRYYKLRFDYFVFGNHFLFEYNDKVMGMYPHYF